MTPSPGERPARVWTDSYAGLLSHAAVVVGETPTRYRVRVVSGWRLRGRRTLRVGDVVLVPKRAVTFEDAR